MRRRKSCWISSLRILAVIAGIVVLLILALAAWQAAAGASEASRYPPPGRLVDLGGYRLHLNCSGAGSPTVILESGLAGPGEMWLRVQPELAKGRRVCSYDRAGLGWSDPSPNPRTSQEIAKELHSLLTAANEPGPYLLVGHSFGGYVVRNYANLYPDEVKGVVLVNAGHEDFNRRLPNGCEAIAQSNTSFARIAIPLTRLGITRLAGNLGLLSPLTGEIMTGLDPGQQKEMSALTFYKPGYWETFVAEMNRLPESEAQVRAAGNLGVLPLVVVSGNPDVSRVPPNCSGSQLVELSKELQKELVNLSAHGQQVVCAECGHYIPITQPDLVIQAVEKIEKEP